MTRDFAGITQESVQLPDLLTLAWAQHLTSSGEQAALVGTGAFSQRGFFPELMVLLWVRTHLTSR